MSELRYIPPDCVRLDETAGGSQWVLTDLQGRRVTMPAPGDRAAAVAVLAVLRVMKLRVLRVEVHSTLSLKGATLTLRRWFCLRRVAVHPAIATALAVESGVALWVHERAFVPIEDGDTDVPGSIVTIH